MQEYMDEKYPGRYYISLNDGKEEYDTKDLDKTSRVPIRLATVECKCGKEESFRTFPCNGKWLQHAST